jgi:hypothetical protein
MRQPRPKTQKDDLAQHVATGGTVPTWCQEHAVPITTAYGWHRTASFQLLVEEYRRRAVDRALGTTSANLLKAVNKIVDLIDKEPAGNLQLAAARTLLEQHVHLESHTQFKTQLENLNQRLAQEEKRRAQKTEPPRDQDHQARGRARTRVSDSGR